MCAGLVYTVARAEDELVGVWVPPDAIPPGTTPDFNEKTARVALHLLRARAKWRDVEVTVSEIHPSPDGPRAVLEYTVDGVEHWVSRVVRDRSWTEGQILIGQYYVDEPEVLGQSLLPPIS
jgi:hypothetical protein